MNNKVMKVVATAAVALGIAGGSYGIANAASGSGSSTTPSRSAAPRTQQPWGGRRSDETVLTGDTLAKVKAAAADSVGNGTIIRVETDADGNAAYEVHFVKSDGTPATVYVDKNFDVVSVETR